MLKKSINIKDRSPDNIVKSANKEVFDGKETVAERAENDLLIRDGISMFDNSNIDNDFTKLPISLVDIESRELGEHLHAFTQNKLYIKSVHCRVSAGIRQIESSLNPHRVRVFSSLDKRLSLEEKKMYLCTDKEAKVLLDKLNYLTEKQIMLKNIIEGIEDAIFDISREVSRRMGDFNENNRVDNIKSFRRKSK